MSRFELRTTWLWPLRVPVRLAAWTDRRLASFDVIRPWSFWIASSLSIGLVPPLLAWQFGFDRHGAVSAIPLAVLFLAAVRRDDLFRALILVGGSFLAHSAFVIALSANNPEAAAILPGSAEYWSGISQWVRTGDDREYRWQEWLPAHAGQAIFIPILAYTTFGALPFAFGFEQIDLMNYYVGRLAAESRSPWIAIGLGWHPWSILRGLGFTILTFEIVSLSWCRWSRNDVRPRGRWWKLWLIGLGSIAADALLKLLISPRIQRALHDNLAS